MNNLKKNQHLLMIKLAMDSESNRPINGELNYAFKNSNQRLTSKEPHMIFPHLHHLLLILVATLLCVSLSVKADKGPVLASPLLKDTPSSADLTDSKIRKLSIESDVKNDELQRRSSDQKNEPIRRRDNFDSDEDTDLARDDPKFITKKPRQHFKIHLGPTKSHKSPFKSMVAKRSQQTSNLQAPTDSTKPVTNATVNGSKVNLKAKSGKQMLSSETLKKLLLNQSLLAKGSNLYYSPGVLNGTSESGKAGSNFKFVFIQKATAAANKGNATKGDTPSSNALSNQSLAASVSKQLASSLLYSAANLVGNLTGAPSLSALTNAVAIKSTGGSQPANNFDLGEEGSNDIRRVQSAPTSTTKSAGVNHALPGGLYVSTPAHARKQKPSRRPSKVYNLPVKFVANGQPNGVVFNTIKQHFATIRKMQSAVAAASANSGANRKTTAFAGTKDRRKQQQQQQQHASDKKKGGLKGTNSRLIYLPLKYISNAKPDRLISPKAAHKSLSATLN